MCAVILLLLKYIHHSIALATSPKIFFNTLQVKISAIEGNGGIITILKDNP